MVWPGRASLAQERIALIIGNSEYRYADALPNPKNDASAIGAALEEVDFDVDVRIDLDQRGMQTALRDFGLKAETAEVAIVYFAGHGIQVADNNYILPVDAQLRRERDLIYEATPLDILMAEVAQARQIGMVILDACRNNPLADNLRQSLGPVRSKLVGLGMARVEDVPPDTLVAFSTRFNQLAYDGWADLSPFTEALVQHIEEPGLELNLFFRKVRDSVMELTADRQEPRTMDALGATPFYFRPPKSNQAPVVAKHDLLTVTDAAGAVPMNIERPVDPDDDRLSIEVMGLPTMGSIEGPEGSVAFGDELSVDQLSALSYRPVEGEIGPAGAFLFVARDGHGGVTAGRVPIKVIRSNKPPVVAEVQELSWPLIPMGIEQPSDPDGDELSITVIALPTYGEIKDGERTVKIGDNLSVEALTSLMLDPNTGAAGSFVYEVDDGLGGVAEATVQLRRPQNDDLQIALAPQAKQAERGVTESVEPRTPRSEDSSPATTLLSSLEPTAEIEQAISAEQPPPVASEEIQVAILETVTGSNIRNGPSATAAWVAAVPDGTPLKFVSKAEGIDWYEIETPDGKQGFISGRLVRPVEGQVEPEQKATPKLEPVTPVKAAVEPPTPPKPGEEKEVAALDIGSPEKIADLSTFKECDACPIMVALPEGRFSMGSTNGASNERPVRNVTIGQPFAIGKYEVTVAEWKACARAGGCRDIGDPEPGDSERPMQNVSWPDAQAYVTWLNKMTGMTYRLPSESEWEYAARGGQSSRFWWGDSLVKGRVNCSECQDNWDRKKPSPIGAFDPNPFGLHDMNGGVAEWVADCWIADYRGAPSDSSVRASANCPQRVLRGGSWRSKPDGATSSSRFYYDSQVRYYTNGFRVARELSSF
jgi:formylglycine-generating enzyme required for sulfatase activity